MRDNPVLLADWPAPGNIRALVTQRELGSFNPKHAPESFDELKRKLPLPETPRWLRQQHGDRVVLLPRDSEREADGSYTRETGVVCCVVSADCLPVLLCSADGLEVAAVHAGWRGMAAGVIQSALDCFTSSPRHLMAWLGPAIGPDHFEVGPDVFQTFHSHHPGNQTCFRRIGQQHWLCNLYEWARIILEQRGVTAVYGGTHCTWRDANHFFSYRRERTERRMATLIWRLEPDAVT